MGTRLFATEHSFLKLLGKSIPRFLLEPVSAISLQKVDSTPGFRDGFQLALPVVPNPGCTQILCPEILV